MDTLEETTEIRIAQRIRLEREARGWSIAVLAEKSGVSKAAISKIERNDASPTAGNLVRLATAFDLTLAGLLVRAEAPPEAVSRAADQPVWTDPATGYQRRQIFARADHPLEMVRVKMPPGKRVALPASSYARIRQAVWVMEGDLTIEDGISTHQLSSGDCLGFGLPGDVTFSNQSSRVCTYLVALSRN